MTAKLIISDHDQLAGLGDDDHSQYLLLAGRAGGQYARGGTGAADDLTLRGTAHADLGEIVCESPIDIGDTTAAAQAGISSYFINAAPTQTLNFEFIGGGINISPIIDFNSAVWIWEGLRCSPEITSKVNPGFAAFALFQALAVLKAGTGAMYNPLNALSLNSGVTTRLPTGVTGTRTQLNSVVINGAHSVSCQVNAATMNITNNIGFQFHPTYSTSGGGTSTVGVGACIGVLCQNPDVAIFKPHSGVANLTSYTGLEIQAIPMGGNVPKAAVKSALVAASNSYFLWSTGDAKSYFGGPIHLRNDWPGGVLFLGASDDFQMAWNGASNLWFWQSTTIAGSPQLRWTPNANNYWTLSAAASAGFGIDLDRVAFGSSAPDPTNSNWFVQFSGPDLRGPTIGGEYADVLCIASGSIAVGGFAMSNLDAFKINSVGYALGGGSVADVSTLHVAAQSNDGIATRSHALRVQGRTRIDGHICHNESTGVAQLTAHVTQLVLPQNNLMRSVYLIDADASGAPTWIVRGILNTQVGDSFYVINDGANSFSFGHQDGAAAAADRIITPTAATFTLGPNEFAKFWYDSTVSRWRILESNGA